jgi:peptidoglycan pentaglycine glycine transferase (the first glycine)
MPTLFYSPFYNFIMLNLWCDTIMEETVRQHRIQQWDNFICENSRAHILQLAAWGELKNAYGWKAERVVVEKDDVIVAGAQLLFRRLPFRLGTMAYLPMGPYFVDDIDDAVSDQLWQEINKISRKHNARFLKWEPGIYANDAALPDFAQLGFLRSPQMIQPPRTVLIDISGDEDEIMKSMNQGTRRKIRQSMKKGARYYQANRDDVDKFNSIMQTTSTRNQFGVHEAAYYELAYELFVPENAALFMAEHENDVLAAIMVFAVGDTAWYLYGASSDIKRNLMASYGVQWKAIEWAKNRGCKYYDMWGVPDHEKGVLEEQFQSRSDGLWGVYGFKRGWGGAVIRSAGAWDKVYNPVLYKAYQLALKLRR